MGQITVGTVVEIADESLFRGMFGVVEMVQENVAIVKVDVLAPLKPVVKTDNLIPIREGLDSVDGKWTSELLTWISYEVATR